MASGDASARAQLFYEPLIESYVDRDPRFVERAWLAGRIERHLDDPTCRFVLLTAEPGAGKTALIAWLARRRPDALRYFIRRDSQTPLSSSDAPSLLFTLGQQLAVLHPALFHPDNLEVAITQSVDTIAPGGQVIGIRVEDLQVSPFWATALRVEQNVGLVAGELIGIEAARARVEPRLLDTQRLQHLALLGPALAAARAAPTARIVVLIDALDELRYQRERGGILDWLAGCPELPESLRIIMSSRPDHEQLEVFRGAQQPWLREESIDHASAEVRADLSRYVERVSEQPWVAAALAAHQLDPARFNTRAVARADGNFQYLVALARAIEQATGHAETARGAGEQPGAGPGGPAAQRDVGRLLRLEDVPEGLPNLYAFFLARVRAEVRKLHVELGGDQHAGLVEVSAWPSICLPVLGLLAVAQEPLGPDQLRELAGIRFADHWLHEVLQPLSQFLEREAGRYRLYHASLAEFLTDTRTRATHPEFYLDAADAHRRIVETAAARRHNGAGWLAADRYVRTHLPTHATQIGRLDELLEDPVFLAACSPDHLLRVLPAATSERARAAERLLQWVGSRLRGRPLGERAAVLELGARQLGAGWIADALAGLSVRRPWSARWAHQQPKRMDRVLGTHDGKVNSLVVGERDGVEVVVSGGSDGMVRVWDLRTGDELLALRHGEGGVETVTVGELTGDGPVVVSGGEDGKLRRWRLADGRASGAPLAGHRSGIASVAVGDLAGRPIIASGGASDFAVYIWDLRTGQPLHALEPDPEGWRRYSYSVHAVAAGTCDGQPVVIAGHQGGAHLWKWTGNEWAGGALVAGHVSTVWAVAIGMLEGKPVAVCGGNSGFIMTWELGTGRRATQALKSPDLDVVGVATGELHGRAIAVTGNYFPASQGAGILRVWDLREARLLGSLVGHHGGVEALAMTRVGDRSVVVSGGFDHRIRVWDLEASLQEPTERSAHPFHKWLLALRSGNHRVLVSQSLEWLEEFPDDFAAPADDEVPDLEEILKEASHAPARVVTTKVWDQADGAPIDVRPLRLDAVGLVEAAGAVGDEVFGVSVAGHHLHTWDLRTGERVGPPVPTGDRFDPGGNIAIGALGKRVAVAFCDHDGRLQLWDAHTGEPVCAPVPTYGRGPAACWAFGAPAGQPVAVVATVGSFGILDLERRDLLAEPRSMQREAHMRGPAGVGELAGRPVAVYSNYARPILVWELSTGRERAIHVDAEISTMTVAADSTILAAGPAGLLAVQVQAAFFEPH